MPKRKLKLNDNEVHKMVKVETRLMSDDEDVASHNNTRTSTSKPTKTENILWSDAELLEFIGRMEDSLPENDSISYHSRLDNLKWEKLTFKDYSVKECQEVWSILLKQVRKYRLLKEILNDVKAWVTDAKKAQSKDSVRRHPDMPKQPQNNYMLFANENRNKVMKENPELGPNGVARKLGTMFKNLSSIEREMYNNRARVARQEYEEQLQEFYEQHPECIPKRTGKRTKGVQLREGRGPPDKPKTPFEIYLQVEMEKDQGNTPKHIFHHKCREEWNEMPDEDKLYWINWAETDFEKYQNNLKKYLKEHPRFEPPVIKAVISKKEVSIKNRLAGKPEKPPTSAYHLFSKMMLQSNEVSDIQNKDVMTFVGNKWRNCSDKDKDEYKARVHQMWDEYDRKFDDYLQTLSPLKRDEIRQKEGRRARTPKGKPIPPEKFTKIKLKKPEVPPHNEYKYFLSMYKGKADPASLWREMSEEQKLVYKEGLELKRQNYISLYEQYLRSLSPKELAKMSQGMLDPYDTSTDMTASSDEESN